MRVCKCCGETKPVTAFSWTGGSNKKPVSHCKECGVWLRLFRQVFGPTRDWQKNREHTAVRCRSKYQAAKATPAITLYQVWGIHKP